MSLRHPILHSSRGTTMMRVHEWDEGRRIITEGLPDVPVRLSRRRRRAVLTMDVDGDAAAVTFVSRPKRGRPELDIWMTTWTYHRRNGVWVDRGGGGGNLGCAQIQHRPTREALGGYVTNSQSGFTRTDTRVLPFRRPAGISEYMLRASAEVDELRIGDRRFVVRDHGYQVIVTTKRRAPKVEAWSGSERVAIVDLADRFVRPRRPLRTRFWFLRGMRTAGWYPRRRLRRATKGEHRPSIRTRQRTWRRARRPQ